MNNRAELYFVGIEVGGNYVRCIVIIVISVGLGDATRI